MSCLVTLEPRGKGRRPRADRRVRSRSHPPLLADQVVVPARVPCPGWLGRGEVKAEDKVKAEAEVVRFPDELVGFVAEKKDLPEEVGSNPTPKE